MGDVKIELNAAGVRALLQSGEVQADLHSRAQRIAGAAGEGMEVESSVGRSRARATVRTESTDARVAEATGRSLTNAIDAGRG
jgi:hypothetical protein